MNNQNMGACNQIPEQQPALLRALSVQHDIHKDTENTYERIYSLINRFENLAMRVEGTTFPKPEVTEPGSNLKCGDMPQRPDGILGQIVAINEIDGRQLNELNQNIIPKLMVVLDHLEKHI